MKKLRRDAGLTLIEVLIAVTLLSMLTVGMAIAMRVGLSAFAKTDEKLMDNRRVAGAQRALQNELEGLMPVAVRCTGGGPAAGFQFPMLQADEDRLRLVSTFSLQQGWRGQPQILEMFVMPGDEGKGVRLVVNEIPYSAFTAGMACVGVTTDPVFHIGVPQFAPFVVNEHSFVLADKLAYCRFGYLGVGPDGPSPPAPIWRKHATGLGWPQAIRIEMAPFTADPSKLQPITAIAPLRIHRSPDVQYGDF
ncbi:MAG TPA: prepilin-type N-terminal cleavage/methylation domain-containing protein [Candidatus Limnocylindrales bacterium]|nr:prepilin-type N-terminal cleavage/methylation domain-containing protein [Candidatus Limnocylindrales bacterium]